MSADLCDTGRDSELEALGRLDPCGRRDYLSSRTGGLGFPAPVAQEKVVQAHIWAARDKRGPSKSMPRWCGAPWSDLLQLLVLVLAVVLIAVVTSSGNSM